MQMPALVPVVQGFFDAPSSSIQYIVACPRTRHCAIVDPVLDFDERSGATGTAAADAILAAIAAQDLKLEWILDTHPHADHLSAAAYLRAKTGAPTAIGARVCEVQTIWRDIYAWPELACDGSQWDTLFAAGETFKIGELEARVLPTPGHTRASVTYVVGDAAFVADTLFMPDTGTARADFPGGSAAALYASIQDLFALSAETRVFTGHDYLQGGRAVRFESTIGAQRASNIHFAARPSLEQFVALREARDRTLPMPRLILHALQVNLQAGRLPDADDRGRRFFKIPLNALG